MTAEIAVWLGVKNSGVGNVKQSQIFQQQQAVARRVLGGQIECVRVDSNAAGQSVSARKSERRPAPVCGCNCWSPHSSTQASCSGVRLNCVDPRGALQAGGGMFETGFVVGLGVEGLVVRCARIPGWVSQGSTDSKTVMVFSSVNKKTQVKPPKRRKTLLNGKDKPNTRGWVTCHCLERSRVMKLGVIGEEILRCQ